MPSDLNKMTPPTAHTTESATFVPDLLGSLRDTVQCAYERSSFFRNLYRLLPQINNLEDFRRLPSLTQDVLKDGFGLADLISFDDDQLVMELSGLSPEYDVTFTPVENEYDMERRYRRMVKMLAFTGALPERTAIVTDNTSIYFAAQIERVLPWPVVTLLCNGEIPPSLNDYMTRVDIDTVIVAMSPSRVRSLHARRIITFNGFVAGDSDANTDYETFDIFTTNLLPWLAISRRSRIYHTVDDDHATERQFYLERGIRGTLIVTSLCSHEQPGAQPAVRYDTNLRVAAVGGHTFVTTPNNVSR